MAVEARRRSPAAVQSGGAELVQLKHGDRDGLPKVQPQDPLAVGDNGFTWIEEVVRRGVGRMVSESFPPTPNQYCQRCAFRASCPACGRGTAGRVVTADPRPTVALQPDDLVRLVGLPLTGEQLAAATAPLEPAVVVAGAGSGKTTVMAARVVWLVASGQVRPDQVLGLTFTNKAAAELAVRIRTALAAVAVPAPRPAAGRRRPLRR